MSIIHERFAQWRLEKRKGVSIIKKLKQSEKLRQSIKDLYEELRVLSLITGNSHYKYALCYQAASAIGHLACLPSLF